MPSRIRGPVIRLGAGASILVILSLMLVFLTGVDVTVTNVGRSSMTDVWIHVTGRSYRIGELKAGANVKQRVRSAGESHVEIEFSNPDGEHMQLNAGGYFESGYRGTIEVDVSDGRIVRNMQEFSLLY